MPICTFVGAWRGHTNSVGRIPRMSKDGQRFGSAWILVVIARRREDRGGEALRKVQAVFFVTANTVLRVQRICLRTCCMRLPVLPRRPNLDSSRNPAIFNGRLRARSPTPLWSVQNRQVRNSVVTEKPRHVPHYLVMNSLFVKKPESWSTVSLRMHTLYYTLLVKLTLFPILIRLN